MSAPYSFSWVEEPLLSASAFPSEKEELQWLRSQGIDILLTLTTRPVRRDWVDEVGLMMVHVPIEDMEAPTSQQIEECLQIIEKASQQKMGINIHCMAGMGRTGTILAAYFIQKGLAANEAIRKVRSLRPGSVESDVQQQALRDYARELGRSSD